MTTFAISYGKAAVPMYRHGDRAVLAAQVDVEVFGDNFLPAYTEGDNSAVVATDSIKNFVLREAGAWDGATLEGLLDHLGRRLLGTYAQMEGLRLSARELRFDREGASGVLFSRSHDDRDVAVAAASPATAGSTWTGHGCAREGLELLKLTGSAFTHFVRDGYTTLPERVDRPLYIGLDVDWRYADVADAVAGGDRHVAGGRGARRPASRSSTASSASRSSTWCTRWAACSWSGSRRWPRWPSPRATSPATRPRGPRASSPTPSRRTAPSRWP